MHELVEEVCNYFNVSITDIAKPKYRHLKEYTYGELVSRILNTKVRLREEFSEMNESTIVRTLKALFPNKPSSIRGYDKYFLNCIKKRKCHKCNTVKHEDEFNKSKAEADGFDSQCRVCNKKYYSDNREEILLQKQEYQQDNLSTIVAKNALRRANKQRATPVWANLEKIRTIYENCPEGYHVDHIIPLNSDLVCGLHVESNLQYLLARDNMAKGNRFNPDTFI